ncbi:FAD binding domain-containing protein [Leeuwenhoekiella parthenopeia]|uniref:Xanthine dehydrogenase family protein subunit M n=1 Tax=Leeuwenhoekiella parthenopeia TaxID=2890320 RepID=A0ABS8GW38_9FLAO|nr:xanthine dehydrogenase family protein subunit M [Leeuwenhoekiella parthenopeia]MCC4213993.1 xanthine dehydrogenase family protein subunit M [Leeuwenhoekiella parthenopeia]
MRPFQFHCPSSAAEALQKHSRDQKTHYLGGGTNLIDLMKEDVERPDHLIEVADLPFKEITQTANGGLMLGATLNNNKTANHRLVRKNFPLLTMAMLSAATEQIRNMATNGGNLLQRTRCPYYFETSMPCNKREPGSGCGALNGANSKSAIFGWSESCVATHPSDMCVALAALNAKVHVEQADGSSRVIPFTEFHRLPGDQPEKDTNLETGELITGIELPKSEFPDHYYYYKVRERSSYAFALVSAAVGLQMQGNTIIKAGLALGKVAHKPWKLENVERFLEGKEASLSTFEAAAELAFEDAQPLSKNEYKIELGKKTLVQALVRAAARS